MSDSLLANPTPARALSPRTLERQVIAVSDMDAQFHAAFTDKLKISILGLLGGTLIKDARMLLKSPQTRPTLEDDGKSWALWCSARNDVFNCYQRLFPEPVVEKQSRSAPIIDVTPAPVKQLKASK